MRKFSKKNEQKNSPKTDPLYVIFEHHLYNFHDSNIDRKTFITNIVLDYLKHLRQQKMVIPRDLEAYVCEELHDQVNTMLVKKIYGFFTIEEYQEKVPRTQKSKARKKYSSLKRAEKKTTTVIKKAS